MKIKIKSIKDKGGLSPVIATILLIALTMGIASIVWVVVANFIQDETKNSEACFGAFDKVKLDYVCYNPTTNETFFYISVKDVDIDEILVGISASLEGETFVIKNGESISHLKMSSEESFGETIYLPGKGGGIRYIYDNMGSTLQGISTLVEISPVIKGVQCQTSGYITDIYSCT